MTSEQAESNEEGEAVGTSAAAPSRTSTALPLRASATAPGEPRSAAEKESLATASGETEDKPDYRSVEELASRLPISELVKIIKGALECGKRNLPFTETELLRAMTFGPSSSYTRALKERAPRSGTRR